MGYVSTGGYGGGFLGRLLLAEPTHRYGERRMILLYAVACLILQIMFWRIPNVVGDAILFSVLGFFAGPFFPTVTSLLPIPPASQIFHPEPATNPSCPTGDISCHEALPQSPSKYRTR
jgi:hypothetical protein